MPEDWIAPVRAATEGGFFDLASHLPAEAAEALLAALNARFGYAQKDPAAYRGAAE